MKARRITRVLPLLLLVLCLFSAGSRALPQRYTHRFFGAFDTEFSLVAYAGSAARFDAFASEFQARVMEYHRLFDIYHSYAGINNLKTINDSAGIAPVEAAPALMDLLRFGRDMYAATGGTVNIALGPVLSLWHDARTQSLNDPAHAALPDENELRAAEALCDITRLTLDEGNGTVFLNNPGMSLDVGAVAKGYAAQRAAREAAEICGVDSYLINAGGNIVTGAPPPDRPGHWAVGLQNPEKISPSQTMEPDTASAAEYTQVIRISHGSVVTSGDYQRFYIYEGKRMGHIIDPETLFSAARYRAVSVIGEDSGICDALSTALFILPEEEGHALAKQMGYEAFWTY